MRIQVDRLVSAVVVFILFFAVPTGLPAQITPADYERGLNLRDKYKDLVVHMPDQVK